MKGIHLVILICLVLLVGMHTGDEYEIYSNDGIRIHSYEVGDIVRVYIKDQHMIQIVDTTAYHDHLIYTVTIESGEISDVTIISHQETEDYGDYIETDWFIDRLLLKCNEPLEVVKLSKKAPNQVVAITGATITSQAVVNGINECIENYRRYLDEY